MNPDDFKKLVEELGSLIDKRAETTESTITAHVSKEIKASEERIKKELRAEIEEAKEELRAEIQATKSELKADIYNLEAKVIKKAQSHERRITNIEEKTGTPNPDKN